MSSGNRVLVVGEDPLVRGTLGAWLSDADGLSLAGLSGEDEDLHARLSSSGADTVLWDAGPGTRSVAMPPEALEVLTSTEVPVLALVADEAVAAGVLRAGARGVLLRDATPERLRVALRAVGENLLVLDEPLAPLLSSHPAAGSQGVASSTAASDVSSLEPLTPRESEVLQLLAQGMSNKEIGARLRISEHTAKFHVNAILLKLDAQSRTEAAVKAARLGWLLL